MKKFICIHGHFYQPPRENPWLEAIELQDSAAPYHDWNERITAECYAPNAHARVLDGEGRIDGILSNYSRMSFNFGPTLLSWMKDKAPDIHQAVIDADKESQKQYSGHGSALAQGYNHIIMPLANRRDKYTQVLWGIHDFESRFGRRPEGMWLPETAADNETLDVLAELEIKFTILSPYQAHRVRPLAGGDWQDVNGAKVDPSMPYLVKLPSGRSLAVFFYDAPIAQAIAFEKLLISGENFAHRLMEGFDEERKHDQLVHVATDGESYGHHFKYGDMALAYAENLIAANSDIKLTVYGEFLENHPPTHEVEIHQSSSWSCSHGVARWKEHCGCNSGGHSDWNQQWRAPLRKALNWLRDQLAPVYETQAKKFLKDPWAARNEYIDVILDRSSENIAKFFGRHAARELSEAEQITALRLLEMQRHAMLMFTSCGWFFDEISGIESVQVIQYASRAMQIAHETVQADLEEGFLNILAEAKSNIGGYGDGRAIYERFVKPAIMTREDVGAHYAVSSLFESYPEEARIYSFNVHQEDRQLFTAGNARLAIGRIKVTFVVTRNSDVLTYMVIHMGEHNLNCGVRYQGNLEEYAALVEEMRAEFERADFPELIRRMDRHFGPAHYSVKNLFRDEQRKVLNQILATTRDEIYNAYRMLTDRYAPLMRFLTDLRIPAYKPLESAMEVVLNSDLRRQFEGNNLDFERIKSLLAECEATKVPVDREAQSYAFKGHLDRLSEQFLKTPEDLESLQRFAAAADLIKRLPFESNLWKPQNVYYIVLTTILPGIRERAGQGDDPAKLWLQKFRALGEPLGFRVNHDSKTE